MLFFLLRLNHPNSIPLHFSGYYYKLSTLIIEDCKVLQNRLVLKERLDPVLLRLFEEPCPLKQQGLSFRSEPFARPWLLQLGALPSLSLSFSIFHRFAQAVLSSCWLGHFLSCGLKSVARPFLASARYRFSRAQGQLCSHGLCLWSWCLGNLA